VDLVEPSAPISVPGAEVVRVDGPRQWLRFHRDTTTAAELVARVAACYPLRDLALEEPAIEDIVRRIYTEGLVDD
jgi:ABC-2 type transport system ATP-binding protein